MTGTRKLLRDALVLVAASVLLLAALEGAARLLGVGAPERPSLPPKSAGVFRILALGGSTVQGVPDGERGFVAQLDRGLRRAAPGRPLEVRNLARSGAGSTAVRATLEAVLGAQPDLLIVLTGHNEFLDPPPGSLQRLRNASWLARAVSGGSPGDLVEEPFPETLTPIDREGAAFQRRVLRFRENLAAIVSLAAEAGVPLLLCTAPSNLADWPPAHRRVTGPDEALRLYVEGRALLENGQPGAARAHFERARDLDPIPRRAFGSFNELVRAQAGRPGVRLVDVAASFQAHAEQGLVGFDLVCDNCHPTPLGNAIIAREIAAVMAEEGLFLARGAPIAGLDLWLERLEAAGGGPDERRRALLRWLLSNALYAMKTPFFNFEASRKYLEQARALAPNDWRVYANLASLELLAGDPPAGRRALRRATELRGRPLDPEDRRVTPYLKEALEGARLDPRDPGAGGS
jgi:lysophospholipase L1-like esterase